MRVKKSQSALEFLTTYGWAFLVILIMIGALNYFGVLDPSILLPDKCHFDTGIGCTDQNIYLQSDSPSPFSEINMVLVNNFGKDITVQQVDHINDVVSINGVQCVNPNPIGVVWFGNIVGEGWPIANGDNLVTIGPTAFPWAANTVREVRILCNNEFEDGAEVHVQMNITYQESSSSFVRTIKGEFRAKV